MLWQEPKASWWPAESYLTERIEEFISNRPADVAKIAKSGRVPGYLGVAVGNMVDPQLQWYFWDIAEVSTPDRAPEIPPALRGVLLVGAYRNSWLYDRDRGWVRIVKNVGRQLPDELMSTPIEPLGDE